MNKPLNRYVGVDQASTAQPNDRTATTMYGRSCCKCKQRRFVAGGTVRWVIVNKMRASRFTCAGCRV
ncbi:MAG: hypothetical protein ACREP7_05480 [Lysobacter sp.]